jgi:hypothetical protein
MNAVVGGRRLRLHLTSGGFKDLFVWGAQTAADAINAALIESRGAKDP